ncbi:MAG: saccharopine dehydrogenase C-terminal domain-containing protein [Planctomycetota bacterium]|nr:saccharopine dehydrogenase C-terminal domain-containing protein [Planctomycetota bacterium]
MARVIVLGAGMVGSVIAADFARERGFDVTIVDGRAENLATAQRRCGGRATTVQADLSSAARIKELIRGHDLVLGALSSSIAFEALRTIAESGAKYCDIAFMGQDALDLDAHAKAHGGIAVVDCGVAPGMSNLLAGYAAHHMQRCDSIEIYVGGLPRERHKPYEYKAGFSPFDVIEEYTRPSRIVENGRVVVREALSEPEFIDFPNIGTLEAFNTDGLRSIATTLRVPNMKEKTLRYPGHIDIMRTMRDTGLFSLEPVNVGGITVRPRDVTAALLFPKWTYEPGEADLTVMRVIARGEHAGKAAVWTWDLFDVLDPATGFTSMSRTTAFPCAIVGRAILEGRINQPGVIVPEMLGRDEAFVQHVFRELEARGVTYRSSRG